MWTLQSGPSVCSHIPAYLDSTVHGGTNTTQIQYLGFFEKARSTKRKTSGGFPSLSRPVEAKTSSSLVVCLLTLNTRGILFWFFPFGHKIQMLEKQASTSFSNAHEEPSVCKASVSCNRAQCLHDGLQPWHPSQIKSDWVSRWSDLTA